MSATSDRSRSLPRAPWLCHAAGFTLIELLVALVIMAALMALIAPKLNVGQELISGQRMARDINGQLSRARGAAIFKQRRVEVSFTAVQMASGLDEDTYRLAGQWQLRHLDGASIIEGDPLVIRFFPDGSSSGGGVTLTNGQRHFRLNVGWLSGRVRIDANAAG